MHSSARWILSLAVLTLLQVPSLVRAQEGDPETSTSIQGRNSWLKQRLTPLALKTRVHVVQLSGGAATGFGVVVSGGYVLTSEALLGQDTSLNARDAQGRTHRLVVQGRSGEFGVALLRFVIPGDAPEAIGLGTSGHLAVGQIVAAIGTGEAPLSAGVISATRRPVDEGAMGEGNMFAQLFSDGSNKGHLRAYPAVIQHDGPLEPEHFGSPLVNRAGELVGINVAYPFRGSAHAIGVDDIKLLLKGLEAGEKTEAPAPFKRAERNTEDPQAPETPVQGGKRAFLGASLASATPSQLGKGHLFGLYVRETQPGGPAAQAGLKAEDVIVALDGKPFADMNAFAGVLRTKRPGERVVLKVLRGAAGVEVEVPVVLGAR